MFAIINNNLVEEIKTLTELEYHELAKTSQLIIDISSLNPVPQVGWILNGNTLVENTSATVVVPSYVTPRQIRLALIVSGNQSILDNITSILAQLPEPNKSIATITWEYSTEIYRSNPILNQLTPMLGLTSEDVDNLFILASTL